MSGVHPELFREPAPPTLRPISRRALSKPIGALLTLAAGALFLLTADSIFAAGYLAPLLGIVWDADADAANAGGQWLVQALLEMVRSIPRAGPELLVLMTITIMAFLVGSLGRGLYRRGWPVVPAALAALLVALHPVTLYLASTGQPAVLALLAVCLLLLAVDLVAVTGDAQALMFLGICFALLFITEPNALYVVLPVMLVLPLAIREMRDGGSMAALLLICILPSIVAIATLLVGSMVVGVAPETTLRHWIAVLHGALVDDALGSTWLSRNGGTFFRPFTELIALCLVCAPMLLTILWRLLVAPLLHRQHVAARLASALLAFGLAPVAGAFAVLFWHPQTQWNAVATALGCAGTWAMTVNLRRYERYAWLALLLLGVYVSWTAPWLWTDPDKLAWRTALFRRL